MSSIQLYLFGTPRLLDDMQPIVIDARKSMAILAYLAVENTAVSRETLLALLWPELGQRRAQNVLRRNLSVLNKALNGRWLQVDKERVGLVEDENAWIDVVQFQQLAQSWQSHSHPPETVCASCLEDLSLAVELYSDDFLSGFSIRNSPQFDDWQRYELEKYTRLLLLVLERLVHGHQAQNELNQAVEYANRWLRHDPLHEPAHRILMQLYNQKGERTAALRQYQHCTKLLNEELGVLPGPETRALHEQILQDSVQNVRLFTNAYAIVDGNTLEGLQKNLIGVGGMGNVYRGINRETGEAVAIKILKPELVATNIEIVQRFVREGEILSQLNHPNIVQMLAVKAEEGEYFLVMEFVGGGNLQELINQNGQLEIDRILNIALDIADALTRAHRLNIIHRDLKPANILLAEDGTPRLTDFGIARLLGQTEMTQSGQILGSVHYLSPESVNGEPLAETADIWAFGIILFEMITGKKPFDEETAINTMMAIVNQPLPILDNLREDVPLALLNLISRLLHKDAASRIASFRLVGAELEAILDKRPLPITNAPLTIPRTIAASPYRGLFAFQKEDASFFFGRRHITNLLNQAVHDHAAVALLGPSGSGKSSVVFAGLLPKIEADTGWLPVVIRPTSAPFQRLAAELLERLDPALSETDFLLETNKLAKGLLDGDIALADIVQRQLRKDDGTTRFLLLIDQFEELFTLCPDPALRQTFLDVLIDIIELQPYQRHPTFTLLITLRADFLEQALAYRPFADVLQDSTILLGPMHRDELKQAIEKPARIQGVTFEPGLVERILDDAGEESGNLPLVEFTLTSLWEMQKAGRLTHDSYDQIGQVAGSLTNHANFVFQQLSPEEQMATKRIFIQLVRPGQGTEDTRRIAHKSNLQPEDWLLVQHLATQRLVTTGKNVEGHETVEIVHETLIRNWEPLQAWMRDMRRFRIWQEQLRPRVQQWLSSDKDKGALLRGIPLTEAENWLEQQRDHLSQIEIEFIEASHAYHERVTAERQAAQKNQERLRRTVVRVSTGGLLISLIFALLAGFQWRNAAQREQSALQAEATAAAERDQATFALSRQMAALTTNLVAEQLALALLLGVEATGVAATGEAQTVLRQALTANPRLSRYLWGHRDRVNSVAYSPDGTLIASGSNDNSILIWDGATGEQRGEPLEGHGDNVLTLAFSPDGSFLASGGADKTLLLWDVARGEPLGPSLLGHAAPVTSISFAPNGRLLAAASGKTIFLWDLTRNPPQQKVLTTAESTVRQVAFGPNGRVLAAGSDDYAITLWDVESREVAAPPLQGHNGWIRAIAFQPDGERLASADEEGVVIIWELGDEPTILHQLEAHNSSVRTLHFSPAASETADGYLLASGSTDSSIVIWDPEAGQPAMPALQGHTDWVRSVAFHPDGEKLVSASHDQSLILWHISGETADPALVIETDELHQDGIRTVAFHPTEPLVATGGDDRTVLLWDMSTQQPVGNRLTSHAGTVRAVTFHPDGDLLATGGDDETVILWDWAAVQPQERPLAQPSGVNDADFSPDGETLVVGNDDGLLTLWSVSDGSMIGEPLQAHVGDVHAVAFGANGRFLASAGEDKQIILWRLEENILTPEKVLQGHEDVIFDLDISPDGEQLVSSSWDRTVRLWDLSAPEPEAVVLAAHLESVAAVAFSPDGETIISGSWDETVLLWHTADRKPILPPLEGHSGSVRAVAFAPDGQTAVSVGDDGQLIVWETSLAAWQARACQRANRQLSATEWQQFFGERPFAPVC